MTKTIEQIEAELRAAQEALAEAQRAKQEQERKERAAAELAKREAEALALQAQVRPLLKAVYDGLMGAGLTQIELQPWGIKVGAATYPDPDLQIQVSREEVGRSSAWARTTYTGRFVLALGARYSDLPRIRYPQGKAGFNVAKIVQAVLLRKAGKDAEKHRREQQEARKLDANEQADLVRHELGLKDSSLITGRYATSYRDGSRYRYTEHLAAPGRVFMQLGTLELTPEQVKVLYAALQQVKAMEAK